MIEEIKDRVPVNVLSNDAIRYGIYDEQGNLLRYEYIKREDEPIEIGTPINRALFSNIQGDLYVQDRYNIPVVTLGPVGTKEIVKTDNLFYQNWENVSNYTEYKANNGMKLYATSTNSERYTPDLAFDTAQNTYWHIDYNGSSTQELKVTFPNPVKILKMGLTANTDASTPKITSIKIFGEKRDGETVELFDVYSAFGAEPNNSVITLNNQDNYISYTLQLNGTPSYGMDVAEWSVLEYSSYEEVLSYVNNLSLPLTSYEDGKIIRIRGSSYIEAQEVTKTGNIFPTSWNKVVNSAENSIKFTTDDGYILESNWHAGNGDDKASNICDGDMNTHFSSYYDSKDKILTITLPNEIKIAKMGIAVKMADGTTRNVQILGSKNKEDWVTLGEVIAQESTESAIIQEVSLNNLDYYKYFRLHTSPVNGSLQQFTYEWQTLEYTIVEYSPEITSFEKPYININNLGIKQIKGTINKNSNYELVYLHGAFYVYKPADKSTDTEAYEGESDSTYMTPKQVKDNYLPSANISIKTGTISSDSKIPQTAGYTNYIYFVSVNKAAAFDVITDAEYNPVYSDTYIDCSVVQSTRVVSCNAGYRYKTYSSSAWGLEEGTANYIEFAWN